MRWWHQYQAWQPESRVRYVATAVGLRALIVFALVFWVDGESSVSEALLMTAGFVAIAVFVFAWFWYPRAKAKSGHTPVPMPTTQG